MTAVHGLSPTVIGKPFRGMHGILSGAPSCSFSQEQERMDDMFGDQPREG